MKTILILGAFVFSQFAAASTVKCSVAETVGSNQHTYTLQAEVSDTDTHDQISTTSKFIKGVSINVFACPGCGAVDEKASPVVEITLSTQGVSTLSAAPVDEAVALMKLSQGTVAANCAVSN